ncbi:nucleotide-diphospho-sugar transferase [Meredithblackwellia eburnea MCA 4105]
MAAFRSPRRTWFYLLGAIVLFYIAVLRKPQHSSSPFRSFRNDRVTVLVTASHTQGKRPQWLLKNIEQLASPDLDNLIDRVILVWNAVDVEPPTSPNERVKVVVVGHNSLNNRWVETLPHIRTNAVLNLDDDITLKPGSEALACMFEYWKENQDRLIGPFARRHSGDEFVMDELTRVPGTPHTMILPRIMMLHRKFLASYAKADYSALRTLVDQRESHADDIVLNAVAASSGARPPLRIALPTDSIIDWGEACVHLDANADEEWAAQTSRWEGRSAFLAEVGTIMKLDLVNTTDVAVCERPSKKLVYSNEIKPAVWRRMSRSSASQICPDLNPDHVPAREGKGRDFQIACPELNEDMTYWINQLMEKPICGMMHTAAEKEALLDSALLQCSTWCVWDMRTKEQHGWKLTPDCWKPVRDGSEGCGDWFYQRPNGIFKS